MLNLEKKIWISVLKKSVIQSLIFTTVMFLFDQFVFRDEKPHAIYFYAILLALMLVVNLLSNIIGFQRKRKKFQSEFKK
ncbi:MAG: hypothetical protein JSS94_08780 [Bacteroidetes bacterium]|nr:hypothetical protein [Bacteroidota bacterium]